MKTLFKLVALLALGLMFINADTDTEVDVEETTEETTEEAVVPASSLIQANSDHYRIFYEGTEADAQNFAVRMESCLDLYNSVLHHMCTRYSGWNPGS